MGVAELLLETASADRELLQKNQQLGDNPEIPRDLDFVLYAKSEERGTSDSGARFRHRQSLRPPEG
jgi:hypothetical protein